MSSPFIIVNPQFTAFVEGTNAPLSFGTVQFYAAGTVNPQPVFSDPSCTIPLTNPVVLDVNGRATIYGNSIYDIYVYDSSAVLQDTILNVSWAPGTSTGSTTSDWLLQSGALVFISATSFSIAGNQTGTFHTGRRIKASVTAGTIYGTIKTAVFGTVTTVTVSWDSGILDSGLSAVSVGLLDSQQTSIPTLNPLPTTTGGTTAYAVTIQRGDLIKGTRIDVIINATNTGASTLATNSGAVTLIKKLGGVALVAGDLKINMVHTLEFDGTNWQLLNPAIIDNTEFNTNTINGNVLQNNSVTTTQVNFLPLAQANLGSASVGFGQLKIATGTLTVNPGGTFSPSDYVGDMIMNDYSFFPHINGANVYFGNSVSAIAPVDAIGTFGLYAAQAGGAYAFGRWHYVTSSDNPTMWVAKDSSGNIEGVWISDDPLPNNACPINVAKATPLQIPREDLSILVQFVSPENIAAGTEKASSEDRIPFRILELEWPNDFGQQLINRCHIVNGKLTLK